MITLHPLSTPTVLGDNAVVADPTFFANSDIPIADVIDPRYRKIIALPIDIVSGKTTSSSLGKFALMSKTIEFRFLRCTTVGGRPR